jgi:hypothetical protein
MAEVDVEPAPQASGMGNAGAAFDTKGGNLPFAASARHTCRKRGSRHSGHLGSAHCSALPQGRSEPLRAGRIGRDAACAVGCCQCRTELRGVPVRRFVAQHPARADRNRDLRRMPRPCDSFQLSELSVTGPLAGASGAAVQRFLPPSPCTWQWS